MKKLITASVASVTVSLLLSLSFAAPASALEAASIEVLQTIPLETEMTVPGVRDTQEVWLEMIRSATTTLDIEQFYVSDERGQALAPVLAAIEDAAVRRGVKVRFIGDSKFFNTYPESIRHLGGLLNVEARIINMTSGVQHAKFFVVNGNDSTIGSANFDWRALSHIHEVGLRAKNDARAASALLAIFDRDWTASVALPGAAPAPVRAAALTGKSFWGMFGLFDGPVADAALASQAAAIPSIQEGELRIVASPPTPGTQSSAEAIVELIGSARTRVRLEVMEYSTAPYDSRNRTPWTVLDHAFRAAAARGVKVEIMVDNTIKSGRADLVALSQIPGITVRKIRIPAWSGGAIEYARLIHSKFVTVDGHASWVGTENWRDSYFTDSRDVGYIAHSTDVTTKLDAIYDKVFMGPYARAVTATDDLE